jgi:hypothetical protein
MIVALPFVLTVLTAIWLVIRAITGRWIVWRAATVVVASAALALAVIAVYCGPLACFTMGPNRALGWFVLGGVAVTALAHHVVSRHARRDRGDGR